MNEHQPRHVFISYVRENQKQVDRLCQELEYHGVKVWLDRNDIKPGARWKDAIREAINDGAFFIACFSKEYNSKAETYMNEELTLAIERLRKIDTDREWFIPVLISECDVPDRSIGAGETLLDINWVPLYEDWDAGIQRILSLIKPISQEIQNLIIALRSEDGYFREAAAKTLGNIGLEAKAAVPALIEALQDENEKVRIVPAEALGGIGPEAKAAVPALIEALRNEYTGVREAAAKALGNIGPEAKAAVPDLIDALKDEDWKVRLFAAEALAYIIGPEAKEAVPILIEALRSKLNWRRSERTEKALEKINTPEAQKALEEYKQKSK